MKIFAASDIHGKKARIHAIKQAVADHGPDVVVLAGDIGNYINAQPVLEALSNLGPRILAVRGNADPFWVERGFEPANIDSLHLRVVDLDGIRFSGLSGTIPVPFRTRFAMFEKQMLEQAAALIDTQTVFVTHPPPYGIRDRVAKKISAGSTGLARLVETRRPMLLICGHIHEDQGITRTAHTVVVNCAVGHCRGFIINIEPGKGIDVFPA